MGFEREKGAAMEITRSWFFFGYEEGNVLPMIMRGVLCIVLYEFIRKGMIGGIEVAMRRVQKTDIPTICFSNHIHCHASPMLYGINHYSSSFPLHPPNTSTRKILTKAPDNQTQNQIQILS